MVLMMSDNWWEVLNLMVRDDWQNGLMKCDDSRKRLMKWDDNIR